MGVLFFLVNLFVGGVFAAATFELVCCHKSKCWHRFTFTAIMFSLFVLLANLSWLRLCHLKYNFIDVMIYLNFLSIIAKTALLSFASGVVFGLFAGLVCRLLRHKFHCFRD
ncbi:hypothetical protein Bccel_0822 [Pseudobacteroides cellulosolvens ATCC 35603 = DSM 2933]|uniref:Uncharacterized protein n=1 Tax=Pseudobacteroides cellulosolvens ATCC 35603 = DSM 2933 TaxID=398512 RepID=A0A0L6JJH2_9FIRM|nr:hypothetical protein Bccel_0822 [Pseudobacteroides cellulosolvens ATCC 35603 = DSM 2933]